MDQLGMRWRCDLQCLLHAEIQVVVLSPAGFGSSALPLLGSLANYFVWEFAALKDEFSKTKPGHLTIKWPIQDFLRIYCGSLLS